jgi:hypothetical protein
MADTTEIVAYYKNTLLSQWVSYYRARETIGAWVKGPIADLLIHDVRDAFDIDTAIGAQLDVIGEYIGFQRTIYGTVVRNYWQVDDYDAPGSAIYGLTDYTDSTINPASVTWRYEFNHAAIYDLEDEEFRFMLKLKRALNFSDNTLYSISAILWEFLGPNAIVFDGKDMTLGYYINAAESRLAAIAASQDLLPKPIGVGLSGIFSVPDPLNVFGFQSYTEPNANTTGFNNYVDFSDNGKYFLKSTDAL